MYVEGEKLYGAGLCVIGSCIQPCTHSTSEAIFCLDERAKVLSFLMNGCAKKSAYEAHYLHQSLTPFPSMGKTRQNALRKAVFVTSPD